jgi:hypothetical protein
LRSWNQHLEMWSPHLRTACSPPESPLFLSAASLS